MLRLHEGGNRLDPIRYLHDDEALRYLMGLKQIPKADSIGDWLRRTGFSGVTALTEVNRRIRQLTLHHKKEITLDIDATLSALLRRECLVKILRRMRSFFLYVDSLTIYLR